MADLQPQLRAVFCEALERKTSQEQADYLDQACEGKPELRARVEALLRAHHDVSGFLQEPQSKPTATAEERPFSELPGTVIGPYRLLQQIGEGGMGVVWMAEQTQPVQRKVALKVIKPGMDSRQIIARFEAERQALAMMDHVNIARVLDAGATEAGLPYFVMELVHGVRITKYCDDNHLTPRERLELFVPVCQAIQHAHQKGIIHRDVKPSNIMVTLYDGKPVPKVIDFGVAKAIEQKLTERTLFTQYGTMVGTLEYMSPEQAEMSAMGVDTRSDIYSLGVLLYELLTGSTPLSHKRLKEAAFAEILRMIKEEEPPKPSTRLSDSGEALASISAQRHMEPAKLTKLVRGELDWIVMKTLEKDRNRRYETASGLADDVQRYLNDEPVLACPPTAWYRFRKFARRNKRALASVTLLGTVLFLAVIGLAVSNRMIDQERAKTAAERDRTKAANGQLKENLKLAMQALDEVYFRLVAERLTADPKRQKEDADLIKKALAFYERFAEQNSDDPEVRREMSRAYTRAGQIHAALGQHHQAKQAHERAIALAEQLAAETPNDPEYRRSLASALIELSAGLTEAGNHREGEPHAQRAFDLRKQVAGEYPDVLRYQQELAIAHNSVGHNLLRDREPAAAAQHFRESIAILTRVITKGLKSPSCRYQSAQARVNLGAALADLDDPKQVEPWREAIPIYRELIDNSEKYRDLPRGERPNPFRCRRDLAITFGRLGRRLKTLADPAAAEHLAEAAKIQAELAKDAPNVPKYRAELADTLLALADLLSVWGRPTDAEVHCRQAMRHLTRLVDEHKDVAAYRDSKALCHIYLGNLRSDAGDKSVAAEHYRLAFDLFEELVKRWPEQSNYVRYLAFNLATCLDPKFRDTARAVREGERLVKMPPVAAISWTALGVAYYRAGDWKASVDALERALKLSPKGGDNMDWIFLAMAHWKLDHAEEARRYYDLAAQRMPSQRLFQRFRAEAAELMGIEEK